MTLVAKNRITEYVNEHPDARITMLTWLKEYPYRQEQNMFSDQEGKPIQGVGTGSAQPDLGEYSIKYRINFSAKAVCITWVGTKQEHQEETEREFKELQLKHSDLQRIDVVGVLKTSNIKKGFKQSVESRQTDANSDIAFLSHTNLEEIAHSDSGNDTYEEHSLITEASYKQALLRIIDIFDVQPDKPEFGELLTLLRLVKNYEDYRLKFPPLQVFEIVVHRMNVLDITALDLATILGSKDEFYQFILGKKALPSKILARLYKFIGIRFPVNDQRFL